MHHALSLSIIRGRGDVVTRLILLLSAETYAMQLCKQGLRQQRPRQALEGVGLRPVASDKAADLPRKQRGETDQKQCAREFAGGDGTNEKSRHRDRDQREQNYGGGIDGRAQAAGPRGAAFGLL